MTDIKTNYEPVIGLEIHVQLKTATKMFCSCSTQPQEGRPNSSICPVCTGQPGTLPVLNREAVKKAITASLALECRVNGKSVFARKNYFYPDLPKGYQISQFELPLAEHGRVEIETENHDGTVNRKFIGITRLHIEEDAGKLLHAIGSEDLPFSLADYNRCGMPLAEIVSEPDMRSPEEAYAYLTSLKNIMLWAGVSGCDMEKGELRVDVNVSVRPYGREKFGTKVELKNLNSFKAVKDSLHYEIERQVKAVEAGEKIIQETRLWDDKLGQTRTMRTKEEAHDYRYFPDPDLVPLCPAEEWVNELKAALPELPGRRKARLESQYSLSAYDAGVLVTDKALADYFEKMMPSGIQAKNAVNWLTTELLGRLNAEKKDVPASPVSPDNLSGLISLIEGGKISNKMAKDVFARMWTTGKTAREIVDESAMSQVSDAGQIETWAREAIAANPKAVEDFKGGNEKAIGALVGLVMKKSKGKANPAMLNSILKKLMQ